MRNVDETLLARWLTARSIARNLPVPVADRGGLRVDTALPHELRRYVFSGPSPGITELALEIDQPLVFLKMCGPAARLQSLVTPKWQRQPGAYLMTKPAGRNPVPSLPPGYWMRMATEGQLTTVNIYTEDDALAASGHAVEHEDVFVFDRIATTPEHQRLGLGAALMAALGTAQKSQAAQKVLVATEHGRALYATLGWEVLSPYSTVAISAAAQ